MSFFGGQFFEANFYDTVQQGNFFNGEFYNGSFFTDLPGQKIGIGWDIKHLKKIKQDDDFCLQVITKCFIMCQTNYKV